jgi:prepilin-type N-terminal cleavage/methylation domain-containing protein
MSIPLRPSSRPGFTILELSVAMAILAVIMVIVAQVGYLSMTQRLECIAKQLALEHANNILEAAQATPYEDLTDQWAADLGLPEDARGYWPDGQLGIKVEPEPDLPRIKRVTVEISWNSRPDRPANAVKLIALFGARQEVKR